MSEKNIKKIGIRDALGEYIYTDIGVDADKVDIDASTNLAEKLVEIDNKFENLKAEGYASKDIYGDEKINLGRKVGTSAGPYSVTIGRDVSATGTCSLAEGKDTAANGNYSHVEGMGTVSAGDYQHVQGKFNSTEDAQNYAHIVGGGSSDSSRRNIHTLDWDGNAEFSGDVITYNDRGVKVSLKNIPNEYAPIISPTFSGTPKAPTPMTGNNSTQIATTAFVQSTLDNKANKYGDNATGTWNINISGKAETATKATQDNNGNNIVNTYQKKNITLRDESLFKWERKTYIPPDDVNNIVKIYDNIHKLYRYCAVGKRTYHSLDGKTFSIHENKDGIIIKKIAVGYINNAIRYIALSSGKLYYLNYLTAGSPNPNTGAWLLGVGIGNISNFSAITYGNDKFLAATRDNSIYQSTDGVAWSYVGRVNIPSQSGEISLINYFHSQYIAYGGDYLYLSDNEGKTWNKISENRISGFINQILYEDNGGRVAVCDGGIILYSKDKGVTWKTAQGLTEASGYNFNSIAYSNGLYVAVGAGGLCYCSYDKINWVKKNIEKAPAFYRSIIATENGFIATGTWSNDLNSDGYIQYYDIIQTKDLEEVLVKSDIFTVSVNISTANNFAYIDLPYPDETVARLAPYISQASNWNFLSNVSLQGNRLILYSNVAQTYTVTCPYLYI